MTDVLSEVLKGAAEERAAAVRLPSAEAVTRSGRERRRRRAVLPALACAGVAAAVAVGTLALRAPEEPSQLAAQGGDPVPSPSAVQDVAPGETYVRALQACYEEGGMTVRRSAEGTWAVRAVDGPAALKAVAMRCQTAHAGLERARPGVAEWQIELAEFACWSVGGYTVRISKGPISEAEKERVDASDGSDLSVASMTYDTDEPPGSEERHMVGLRQACQKIDALQLGE